MEQAIMCALEEEPVFHRINVLVWVHILVTIVNFIHAQEFSFLIQQYAQAMEPATLQKCANAMPFEKGQLVNMKTSAMALSQMILLCVAGVDLAMHQHAHVNPVILEIIASSPHALVSHQTNQPFVEGTEFVQRWTRANV